MSTPVFVACLFVSRLFMLALLFYFTGGQEFADDTGFIWQLVEAPFEILQGYIDVRRGSYPPLLGIFLWGPLALCQNLGNFLGIRVLYIILECLGAWGLLEAVRVIFPIAPRNILQSVLFFLPMTVLGGLVMAQDEMLAYAFVCVFLWLVAKNKDAWATIVLGFSVVVAKIFLLLPLVAYLLWRRATPWRWVLAFAPSIVVYLWVLGMAWLKGGLLPLWDFEPEARYGIGIWTWLKFYGQLSWPISLVKFGSLVLALLTIGMFLLRQGLPGRGSLEAFLKFAWLFCLLFFASFYQLNPEYYLIVLPFLALECRRVAKAWVLLMASALPWAVNFFYGIHWATLEEGQEGKGPFLALYSRVFTVAPEDVYQCLLGIHIVILLGFVLWALVQKRGVLVGEGAM